MIPISSHIYALLNHWGYTICGETVCAKCADSKLIIHCILFSWSQLHKLRTKCLQRKISRSTDKYWYIYDKVANPRQQLTPYTHDSEQANLLWGSLETVTSGETLVSRLGDLQSFIGQRSSSNSNTGSARRAIHYSA